MRRLLVCCLVSAVCCLPSCQKNAPSTKTTTNVHRNVIPEDARNEKVKELIPMQVEVLERSALGTKLGPDGNVQDSRDVITRGRPVYVSMWLKESPGGLQTSVLFTDAKGKQVAWPKKAMKGEKTATFTLDTTHLEPGKYHAQCYWGMNIECDYDFTIETGKKKR